MLLGSLLKSSQEIVSCILGRKLTKIYRHCHTVTSPSLFTGFNLNERWTSWHPIVLAFPLPLDFNSGLGRGSARVAEVQRLEWVGTLLRKNFNLDCSFLIGRRIRIRIDDCACQNIDRALLGGKRKINLLSKDTIGDKHFDLDRTVSADNPDPLARINVPLLCQ